MTQGDPLVIIAYIIGILPLIKNLKREIPDVTQPWYADDAGALSMLARIDTYFNSLTHQGPGRGYHLKQSKIILVVHPKNIKALKVFGGRHGFKLCMGVHYLRGYIGDGESKHDCQRERMLTWEKNIGTISKTTGKYPQ